jgi:L-ribulose-5-phosphate 3-epimerase
MLYGQKDEASRQKNLDVFLKNLDLIKDFGARMAGIETGSLNSDYTAHRDNHGEEAYRIFLGSVEKMAGHAERMNVFAALEAVEKHIINTPRRMKRIIDDISSENLAVIFDTVNLFTA